jgi:hypothetical protein
MSNVLKHSVSTLRFRRSHSRRDKGAVHGKIAHFALEGPAEARGEVIRYHAVRLACSHMSLDRLENLLTDQRAVEQDPRGVVQHSESGLSVK